MTFFFFFPLLCLKMTLYRWIIQIVPIIIARYKEEKNTKNSYYGPMAKNFFFFHHWVDSFYKEWISLLHQPPIKKRCGTPFTFNGIWVINSTNAGASFAVVSLMGSCALLHLQSPSNVTSKSSTPIFLSNNHGYIHFSWVIVSWKYRDILKFEVLIGYFGKNQWYIEHT